MGEIGATEGREVLAGPFPGERTARARGSRRAARACAVRAGEAASRVLRRTRAPRAGSRSAIPRRVASESPAASCRPAGWPSRWPTPERALTTRSPSPGPGSTTTARPGDAATGARAPVRVPPLPCRFTRRSTRQRQRMGCRRGHLRDVERRRGDRGALPLLPVPPGPKVLLELVGLVRPPPTSPRSSRRRRRPRRAVSRPQRWRPSR